MRIYLSYRFTGADQVELKQDMELICAALSAAGHEPFCALWTTESRMEKKFTHKQVLDFCYGELDKCDAVLAYVSSDKKSEGMLLEIGYCLAKGKRLFLAIKRGVSTVFLREISEKVIEFDDVDGLCKELAKF